MTLTPAKRLPGRCARSSEPDREARSPRRIPATPLRHRAHHELNCLRSRGRRVIWRNAAIGIRRSRTTTSAARPWSV